VSSAPPLLLGSYAPPAVRVGRVRCLYRGAWCKLTSWTDAPIPLPRVLPVCGRGRPGAQRDAVPVPGRPRDSTTEARTLLPGSAAN
jgi:hypothetical protein